MKTLSIFVVGSVILCIYFISQGHCSKQQATVPTSFVQHVYQARFVVGASQLTARDNQALETYLKKAFAELAKNNSGSMPSSIYEAVTDVSFAFPYLDPQTGSPPRRELARMFTFRMDVAEDVSDFVSLLATTPDVEMVQLEQPVRLSRASSTEDQSGDPFWAYDYLGLNEISSATGDFVPTIAIIDSGLDLDHEQFEDVKVEGGIDFVAKTEFKFVKDASGNYSFFALETVEGSNDTIGHGTSVLGILAANGKGGEIARGVIPEATYHVYKAFLDDGTASPWVVAAAILHAEEHGADIINMSFSTQSDNEAIRKAIQAVSDDVVLVSSAGNEGYPQQALPKYPATYASVLGVSAIDCESRVLRNSNFNYQLFMPGQAIKTTLPDGGYRYQSGTSMATPFAAGLAALILNEKKDLTPEQVNLILMNFATSQALKGAGGNLESLIGEVINTGGYSVGEDEVRSSGDCDSSTESLISQFRWLETPNSKDEQTNKFTDKLKVGFGVDEKTKTIKFEIKFDRAMSPKFKPVISFGLGGTHRDFFADDFGGWATEFVYSHYITLKRWMPKGSYRLRIRNLVDAQEKRYCEEDLLDRLELDTDGTGTVANNHGDPTIDWPYDVEILACTTKNNRAEFYNLGPRKLSGSNLSVFEKSAFIEPNPDHLKETNHPMPVDLAAVQTKVPTEDPPSHR